MDGFVAAAVPAGALLYAQGVIGATDENPGPAKLLEVAFHTQVRVANGKHLGVHRTMRGMADGAAFPRGLMLENVRTALRGVTAEAAFVFGDQGSAAAAVSGALVWGMAIGAGHFPFGHGMVARQAE